MTRTNNVEFAKEFRQMMDGRKATFTHMRIADIPMPMEKEIGLIRPTTRGRYAKIKGIEELFFERLNGQEVQLVGRTQLKKRQVLSDGAFRKDTEGNYVYEDVPVPRDSVSILSSVSIGLRRYTETKEGRKKEHKVSEGFRYVDYITTKEGRKYIYIIPKEYVYRLNMCALVMTVNRRRNFFKGVKMALQNGTYMYLYVIPFTYRENIDLHILGLKSTYLFDSELEKLLTFWVEKGVLFDPRATALTEEVKGQSNLGYEELEGTILSEDSDKYEQVSPVSMKEEGEEAWD